MKNNYFTTGDLWRTLGISKQKANEWAKRFSELRPERDGVGTGYTYRFSESQVLAIAVSLNLRNRGFSIQHAGNVCNWMLARDLSAFKDDWAVGRVLLVAVGDKLHPRLLTHEAVYQNPAISLPEIFACGLPVAVIDTQAAFRLLMERLAETRETSQKDHNDNHDDSHDDWLIHQSKQLQHLGGVVTT